MTAHGQENWRGIHFWTRAKPARGHMQAIERFNYGTDTRSPYHDRACTVVKVQVLRTSASLMQGLACKSSVISPTRLDGSTTSSPYYGRCVSCLVYS